MPTFALRTSPRDKGTLDRGTIEALAAQNLYVFCQSEHGGKDYEPVALHVARKQRHRLRSEPCLIVAENEEFPDSLPAASVYVNESVRVWSWAAGKLTAVDLPYRLRFAILPERALQAAVRDRWSWSDALRFIAAG